MEGVMIRRKGCCLAIVNRRKREVSKEFYKRKKGVFHERHTCLDVQQNP